MPPAFRGPQSPERKPRNRNVNKGARSRRPFQTIFTLPRRPARRPPALRGWSPWRQPNSPRSSGKTQGCLYRPQTRVDRERRAATPRSDPSPSYLRSELSAGKSMAGGAATAPSPSPSSSRLRTPELPPCIAGRARAAAQPAGQPSTATLRGCT